MWDATHGIHELIRFVIVASKRAAFTRVFNAEHSFIERRYGAGP